MTKEQLLNLPVEEPDPEIFRAVKDHWNQIAKPLDGMGEMETLLCRIGAAQKTDHPATSPRALLIMCADNGVVEEGVSQSGQEVTLAVARNMGMGKSSACRMAKYAGADVMAVDIGINSDQEIPGVKNRKIARGTRNFCKEPAMTEEEVLSALKTGMEMVRTCREEGYALLATGEMGIGNTTTSAAVIAALLDLPPALVTGRGAGLDDEGLNRKRKTIEKALARYHFPENRQLKAFEVLRCLGGLDIAGLCGIFLGGARYKVPVIADGVISLTAALCAERMIPGVRGYILPSHEGNEPACGRILRELSLKGVIHADLALGEGTGAVMLLPLLDMALTIYDTCSSFGDIGVSQYERYSET